MREIRTSGSEGGGAEPNRRSLPLLSQPWAPAFAGVGFNKTTTYIHGPIEWAKSG
jgi:hypothetical protein